MTKVDQLDALATSTPGPHLRRHQAASPPGSHSPLPSCGIFLDVPGPTIDDLASNFHNNETGAAVTWASGMQIRSLWLPPCSRLRIAFCFRRPIRNCRFPASLEQSGEATTPSGCEQRHPLLHLQAKAISMSEIWDTNVSLWPILPAL